MIKIGCVAVVPNKFPLVTTFQGIQCAKGRGVILPGGRYEPDVDASYHHTACRELKEELGLIAKLEDLEYIWHGPDGGDFITFAFLVKKYTGTPIKTNEGSPYPASWQDLLNSDFAGWYRCLKDVLAVRQAY